MKFYQGDAKNQVSARKKWTRYLVSIFFWPKPGRGYIGLLLINFGQVIDFLKLVGQIACEVIGIGYFSGYTLNQFFG